MCESEALNKLALSPEIAY